MNRSATFQDLTLSQSREWDDLDTAVIWMLSILTETQRWYVAVWSGLHKTIKWSMFDRKQKANIGTRARQILRRASRDRAYAPWIKENDYFGCVPFPVERCLSSEPDSKLRPDMFGWSGNTEFNHKIPVFIGRNKKGVLISREACEQVVNKITRHDRYVHVGVGHYETTYPYRVHTIKFFRPHGQREESPVWMIVYTR